MRVCDVQAFRGSSNMFNLRGTRVVCHGMELSVAAIFAMIEIMELRSQDKTYSSYLIIHRLVIRGRAIPLRIFLSEEVRNSVPDADLCEDVLLLVGRPGAACLGYSRYGDPTAWRLTRAYGDLQKMHVVCDNSG